jgi:hypothetical protein
MSQPVPRTSWICHAAGGSVPSPVAAVVPVPVVPVQAALDAPVLDAPVLDTGVLSDAVTRAQDEARRLADDARVREAQARDAAERPGQAEKEAAQRDAETKTEDARHAAEQARRVGRLGEPDPPRLPGPTVGSTRGSSAPSSRSSAPRPPSSVRVRQADGAGRRWPQQRLGPPEGPGARLLAGTRGDR